MERRKNDLSILGFGCMRFPRKAGNIDMAATEKLLAFAIKYGINYFDTAYIYPGSEKALGELVAKNGWREQIKIATKMPQYLYRSVDDLEKKFQEQLKRLQTDYVDNYLMHMLPDVQSWEKLVKLGVPAWVQEKKAAGQIRQFGFSYHGNTENFIKLLDAYDWDFCQVQYNYMDENSQAGRAGVEYAASKNIPVIIMEPLRGGKLADGLPESAKKIFASAEPVRSGAEWGLRWLWNQESVTCVLSGMNTMAMLKENIRIARHVKAGELTEADFAMYEEAKKAIGASVKVPCTGCGYCQPCPKGVDIPGAFRCLNASHADGWFTGMREYIMTTTLRVEPTNASLCVKCGKCEQHCPQHIEIRKELDGVMKRLENPAYKVVKLGSRLIFRK